MEVAGDGEEASRRAASRSWDVDPARRHAAAEGRIRSVPRPPAGEGPHADPDADGEERRRPKRSWASTWAPTTTSPSRSARASCARGSARCCGARCRRAEPVHRFGDCEVDFARAEVRRGGAATDLTAIELKMLEVFLRQPGRVLTRAQVIDEVWGRTSSSPIASSTRTSSSCAARVEPIPAEPRHIVSVGASATGSNHELDTRTSRLRRHHRTRDP